MAKLAGRILIVDDQPALLRMMSFYLTRLGYSVATANTTEKALAHVRADPEGTDVAVLDATMPGLSMRDLATSILAANPNLRVLGASGYPVDMAAVEAAAPGRVSFLCKPFTPEMLDAAVRRLLGTEKEDV
jgi:two-component system, cell cycle sensor histidine kinase and response regulator CckA